MCIRLIERNARILVERGRAGYRNKGQAQFWLLSLDFLAGTLPFKDIGPSQDPGQTNTAAGAQLNQVNRSGSETHTYQMVRSLTAATTKDGERRKALSAIVRLRVFWRRSALI